MPSQAPPELTQVTALQGVTGQPWLDGCSGLRSPADHWLCCWESGKAENKDIWAEMDMKGATVSDCVGEVRM